MKLVEKLEERAHLETGNKCGVYPNGTPHICQVAVDRIKVLEGCLESRAKIIRVAHEDMESVLDGRDFNEY